MSTGSAPERMTVHLSHLFLSVGSACAAVVWALQADLPSAGEAVC
jgi:hypothetical protein